MITGEYSKESPEISQSLDPANQNVEDKKYDLGYRFLKQRSVVDGEIKVSDTKLMRKVDIIIMPLLCAIYFLQFLDKTLLNYSVVMGISANLKGNEFSNLGTIFYAAYIFAEPFMAFLLQKFPLAKTLSFCIILWGITSACHAACHSYAPLMIVRTLLGVFESSSAVGIISISSMYYNKPEQASRIGIWATMSGFATIIGAILSFAFQHIHTKVFKSWQILFLVVGLVTVVFGIFVYFYLPDNVTSSWFLEDEEKVAVLEHIRENQTGTENKSFKKEQLIELLFEDKLTWPMLLLTGTSQIVTGALGTFSSTIISTFGYDSYKSALLQIPSGAIIVIIILISTKLNAIFGNWTMITLSMFVPSIVGAIVLLSIKLDDHKIGNLFSMYLLYSGSSAITLIYIWNSANTSGYTKRIFRNGLTMIVFSLSSLLGPQMFRQDDFPRYTNAKIAILVTQIISIPLTILVMYISKVENEKKTPFQENKVENYEFLDSTDIQNQNFKYLY